jgi:hypothetical protein
MRKLPVTDPEAVYVAFPFRLPESEVVYEAQGGNVVPGRDQLPGSSSDWHTVQSFVAARAPTAEIVVSTDEVPLWQLGGINLGQFKYVAEVDRPHLYSWVLNNYWVTNFRASQEGELRWRYDVTSRPRGPTSGLTRFGWDNRIPLVARALPAAAEAQGEPTGTLLAEPLPSNVLLVSARATEDGQGLFLHLRELDGLETRVDLRRHLDGGRVRSVATVDALGRQPEPASQGVSVPPLGVCFLRVELGG